MVAALPSPALQEFKRWANEYKEAERIRLKREGLARCAGTAEWWRKLAEPMRVFVLYQCCPDDWQRWVEVPWASLPDGLRSCIGIEARAIMRAMEGCSWR